MKITTDMFDFILILIILGLMLPFIFSAVAPLTDMNGWGFDTADDKTMKLHGGDVLTTAELYADDTMTAAEIVLLTRVHDRDTVSPNRYRLPDGAVITVDGDYPVFRDEATAGAQAALGPTRRYRFRYDFEAGICIIQ